MTRWGLPTSLSHRLQFIQSLSYFPSEDTYLSPYLFCKYQLLLLLNAQTETHSIKLRAPVLNPDFAQWLTEFVSEGQEGLVCLNTFSNQMA